MQMLENSEEEKKEREHQARIKEVIDLRRYATLIKQFTSSKRNQNEFEE